MNPSDRRRNRHVIIALMAGCVISLLVISVRASVERSVFDNATLMKDVWFQVTLLDAYLGFLIFYVWVAWKERAVWSRIVWFALIMAFGNMATAIYVIVQIVRHPADRPVSEILLQRRSASENAANAEAP